MLINMMVDLHPKIFFNIFSKYWNFLHWLLLINVLFFYSTVIEIRYKLVCYFYQNSYFQTYFRHKWKHLFNNFITTFSLNILRAINFISKRKTPSFIMIQIYFYAYSSGPKFIKHCASGNAYAYFVLTFFYLHIWYYLSTPK